MGLDEGRRVDGGGGDEFNCLVGGLYADGCVAEGREVGKWPLANVPFGKARAPTSGLPCVGDIDGRFFIGDGRLCVE